MKLLDGDGVVLEPIHGGLKELILPTEGMKFSLTSLLPQPHPSSYNTPLDFKKFQL